MRDRNVSNFMRRRAATLGFTGFIIVMAAVVYSLEFSAQKNHEAIKKGCILLNNAIVESSRSAVKDPATRILLASILKHLTPQQLQAYKVAVHHRPPTIVKLVRCDIVANHPDQIRAIPAPGTPGF